MKYDKDERGADVDEQTALELRRIANLFLLSSITLVLFLLRAFAEALSVTFIPRRVYVVWGLIMLTGWAATASTACSSPTRRGAGSGSCCALIPVTCVPAAVAYAWIRRQEIERALLGDQRAPAARQRRGGKKR